MNSCQYSAPTIFIHLHVVSSSRAFFSARSILMSVSRMKPSLFSTTVRS